MDTQAGQTAIPRALAPRTTRTGFAPGAILRAADDRTYVVDASGAFRRCAVVEHQVVGVRKDRAISPRQRRKLQRAARRQA